MSTDEAVTFDHGVSLDVIIFGVGLSLMSLPTFLVGFS